MSDKTTKENVKNPESDEAVVQVEQPKKEEKAPEKVEQPKKVLSIKKQEELEETEDLQELGKIKQKQRLDALKASPGKAPVIVEHDEREQKARFYVPEAFIHEKRENWRKPGTKGEYKKGSTKTVAWSADTDTWKRKMANQGYTPVTENGLQIKDGGGDLLWEAPIEFEKAKLQKSMNLHKGNLRAENEKFENDVKGAGGRVKEDNIKVEISGG